MANPRMGGISIQIPGESAPLVFATARDVHVWAQEEASNWAWMTSREIARSHPNIQPVASDLQSVLQHLVASSEALSKSVNEQGIANDQTQAQLTRFTSQLNDALANKQLFLSRSPIGIYIREIANRNRQVAAFAYRHLRGLNCDINVSPTAAEGVVLGSLFNSDVRQPSQATVESLNQLLREAQQHAAKTKEELNSALRDVGSIREGLLTSSTKAIDEAGKHRDSAQKELVSMLDVSRAQVGEMIAASKSDFENIKTAFSKELALEAPVTYWTAKRTNHRWLAGGTALLTLTGFYVLAWLIGDELMAFAPAPVAEGSPLSIPPNAWTLAIPLLHLALGVWLLRVLVRLFLSQIHLASDASERATMVEAYLALLKEGSGLKDDDRALILSSIFRQASTGIVHDDAAPTFVASALSRVLSGGGRSPR